MSELCAYNSLSSTLLESQIELGMPELGLHGLSENWLLKELGHRHWRLIGNAIGQKEASFKDSNGNEVYAAFCALSIDANNLDLANLDRVLEIKSNLYRVSPARLTSCHQLKVDEKHIATVTLVSTFVSRHGKKGNRHIARLNLPLPHILPVLPPNITFPEQAVKIAKGIIKEYAGLETEAKQSPIIEGVYSPCPSIDFNRVGLLYFPTFTMAAERFLFEVAAYRLIDKIIAKRDVIFLSNIDIGEKLYLELHDEITGQDYYKNYILIKSSSGKVLAKIFSSYKSVCKKANI